MHILLYFQVKKKMKNGSTYQVRRSQNEPQGDATKMTVCVRNASKSYGLGKRRSNVLNSLDMTVKKGTM